jgi:predicted O-methyltransferase YrrM
LARVKDILGGKEVDFVFIDGDHSYEGVKTDFEMFSRLVRRGGIIALHDIVINPAETGCEVSKFWDEIKQPKYECSEIVSDWNQGWSGIGLLQWQK